MDKNLIGIIMMLLGVVWFISYEIIYNIFPNDYSNFSALTALIILIYLIIINYYVPYWFISRGYNKINELEEKNL